MSKYTDAVERALDGLDAVSVGTCPGCDECYQRFGNGNPEDFVEDWHACKIIDEGSFSHSECGICGSRLGGDRYIWHWVGDDGVIQHEDDCCVDCLVYLANGDEPEEWEG